MQEKFFYIYKISNKINGKIYIGKTNNISKRFTNHISRSKTLKTTQPIHFAIAKHGKNNFSFEIIETCKSEEESTDREMFWIRELKSKEKQFGYNITDGGEGTIGFSHTDQAKKKISEANSGVNNYLYGQHMPKATRDKISQSNALTKINNSKLSTNDVIAIKKFIAEGKLKGIEIAKMFNTTPVIISKIKHNNLWSHIN